MTEVTLGVTHMSTATSLVRFFCSDGSLDLEFMPKVNEPSHNNQKLDKDKKVDGIFHRSRTCLEVSNI
jgi:hypothetical protein